MEVKQGPKWGTSEKQPPDMFCDKCSQKFRKIHKKSPVSESLWGAVTAGIFLCYTIISKNFTK